MRVGIAKKLNILFVSAILSLGVFLCVYFIRHETHALESELNERAALLLTSLSANSEFPMLVGDRAGIARLAEGALKHKDVTYCRVLDAHGAVLFEHVTERSGPVQSFSSSIVARRMDTDSEDDVVLGAPATIEETVGTVELGLSLSSLNEKIRRVTNTVALIAGLTILLVSSGSFLTLKFLLITPITQLVNGTQKISLGDLSHKVRVNSSDEIGKLAASFNQMTENLSRTLVSKRYVDDVIESMTDTLAVTDPAGRIRTVNPALCNLLGYSARELIGRPLDILFPADSGFASRILASAASGVRPPSETTYVSRSGKQIPMLLSSSVIRGERGDVRGVVCAAHDITERKRVEDALRNGEAMLSNAMKIASLGHWEYDVAKDTFTFNDSFYAMFRTTAEQVGGYTMSSADYVRRFVHPEDAGVVGMETREAIETDDPDFNRQLEHRMIYADGEVGHITVRFFIVKDERGTTIKTYGVNQDITKRKRAEEAVARQAEELACSNVRLEQANAELMELDTLKSDFLSNVSHELRTPLTSIKAYAETMLDYGSMPEEQRQSFMKIVVEQTERLTLVIEDLLDLS
ncbi:MAG: PAS domain S-box protein, partial [Candidatus Eisenbacteria bacterium]